MTKAPASVAHLAGPRLRRNPAAWAAVILMAGTGLAWAGPAAWEAIQTWGTPTCSWPLQVHGTAGPAHAGLVRCYLRALAGRDTAGLMAVAADIPPVRITSADLAYSADARAGLATAAFTPNPVDPTSAFVTITYADHPRQWLARRPRPPAGSQRNTRPQRWQPGKTSSEGTRERLSGERLLCTLIP